MRRLPVLVLLPIAGCLTYEAFLAKKYERQCEVELAADCNPNLDCEQDTGDLPPEACDFDASAARECLNGVWTCDTSFVGFEHAIEPQICDLVCRPADPGQ